MSGNSSHLNLNATNQQNIVLNQQNLINRGNIIVNQTQNTQNLILNQTNIMQNSQNIILNHSSPQSIVLNQNNLLSRPPSVQNPKQNTMHTSPCQSPYQIFNTNATMVGSNNLSLISNFPQNANTFSSGFQQHTATANLLQQGATNASGTSHHTVIQSKNVSPTNLSNLSSAATANVQSTNLSQSTVSAQIGTKINQQQNISLSSNNAANFASNYSNPSPLSNPINSPYSNQILSPSNSVSSVTNLKSPVQSPSPILRPTTPQPQIIQQTFQQLPVMTSGPNQLVQIIQAPNTGASYQNHPILNRQSILAPTTHIQTNTIKIKQPLNILPKPPSSVNSSTISNVATINNTSTLKNTIRNSGHVTNSQIGTNQTTTPIVLPNQAILPQGQTGTLVLNQMPLLVQQNTPQGIQLVLRSGTPSSAAQLTTNQRTQNLILQQSNTSQTPTVLIQHNSRPTAIQQPQQLVRVLTANGMIQQLATTPTFIAMNGQPINLQHLSQQKSAAPQLITTNQTQQNINIQAQNMAALSACIPNLSQITQQLVQQQQQAQQQQPPTPTPSPQQQHQSSQHQSSQQQHQQQQIAQLNNTGSLTTVNLIQQQQQLSSNNTGVPATIQLHAANSTSIQQQHNVVSTSSVPGNSTNVMSSISGNATQIINAVATNTTNVTNALSSTGGGSSSFQSARLANNINDSVTGGPAVIKVIAVTQSNESNNINVCASQRTNISVANNVNTSFTAPKKKPKKKKKCKETKVDLANLMKLSGIGDDDDIYLETDIPDGISQTNQSQQIGSNSSSSIIASDSKSFASQSPVVSKSSACSSVTTPKQSPIQQLARPQINAALECNQVQTSQSQTITIASPNADIQSQGQQQPSFTPTSILSQNTLQKLQSHEFTLSQSEISNLISFPSQIGSIQISAITDNNSNKAKSTPQIVTVQSNQQTTNQQSIIHQPNNNNHSVGRDLSQNQPNISSIPAQIGNIQISQICAAAAAAAAQQQTNSNANVSVTANLLHTNTNSGLIQHNSAATAQGNIIVQQQTATNQSPSNNVASIHNIAAAQQTNVIAQSLNAANLTNINIGDSALSASTSSTQQQQPLGGFKLAMSEDGRFILQHDPTLHQDLQSQLILQQLFGLNIIPSTVQPNIVFTTNPGMSISQNITSQSGQITNTQPIHQITKDNFQQKFTNTTKTINSVHQTISTSKIENNQLLINEPLVLAPGGINGQLMLSLSAEQLENLKNNSQFSISGPALVINNPTQIPSATNPSSSNLNTKTIQQTTNQQNPQIITNMKQQTATKTTKGTNNENVFINTNRLSAANNVTSPKCIGKVVKKTNKSVTNSTIQTNIKTVTKCAKIVLQDHLNVKNNVINTPVSGSNILHTLPQAIVTTIPCSSTNTLVNTGIYHNNQITCGNLILPSSTSSIIASNAGGLMVTSTGTTTHTPITFSNSSATNNQQLFNKNLDPIISSSSTPSIIVNSSAGLNMPQLVPISNSSTVINAGSSAPLLQTNTSTNISSGTFQRVQTIQLTPQKQQQLKSVQLQIQALSNRLQNKTLCEQINKSTEFGQKSNENSNLMTDSEIQITLQRLFAEQQKILATGKLLPSLPAQALPIFTSTSNNNTICGNNSKVMLNNNNNNNSIENQILPTLSGNVTSTIIGTNVSQQTVAESVQMASVSTAPTKIPNAATNFNSNSLSQQSPKSRTILPSVPQNSPQQLQTQQHSQQTQNQQQQQSYLAPKVFYQHQIGCSNEVMQVNVSQHQPQCSVVQTQNQPIVVSTSVALPTVATSSKSPLCLNSSQNSNVSIQQSKPVHIPITVQTNLFEKSTQIGSTQISETSPKFLSPNSNLKPTSVSPKCLKKPVIISTKPAVSRSALFEQQLSMDQQEAANPDIHTPFTSKADACKRLVRYHCFNQPVLSQKDLDKADEIFELTARHFIDKFYNMVNKYKTLRLMESMREVPTSELMMIDRMFIAGEQQELEQLRAEKLQRDLEGPGCDVNISNLIKHEDNLSLSTAKVTVNSLALKVKSNSNATKQELIDETKEEGNSVTLKQEIKSEISDNNAEYDEWLCIQKELGYVESVGSTNDIEKTKTSVKLEMKQIDDDDDSDIEQNIKSFEIRPEKRSLGVFEYSNSVNESHKRICNNDRTTTIIKEEEKIAEQQIVNNNKCNSILDDVKNDSSTNILLSKHVVVSESEVFRTATNNCNSKKPVVGGGNSNSNVNSVSQSKLVMLQSQQHHTNDCIDLELDLGLEQFTGINLLKTNHLECSFDENIDAQVQSAIDSILNLQQNQDGSINMNAIITSTASSNTASVGSVQHNTTASHQHETMATGGVVDDKNAQFFNDLLGVSTNNHLQSTTVRKVSSNLLSTEINCGFNKRKIEKLNEHSNHNQLYDDLTTCEPSDVLYRASSKSIDNDTVDSFSECSSPDDVLDQAVRSILS